MWPSENFLEDTLRYTDRDTSDDGKCATENWLNTQHGCKSKMQPCILGQRFSRCRLVAGLWVTAWPISCCYWLYNLYWAFISTAEHVCVASCPVGTAGSGGSRHRISLMQQPWRAVAESVYLRIRTTQTQHAQTRLGNENNCAAAVYT